MKLTDWFPGDVKPVRKGVYQKLCGHGVELGYQYWNGKYWCYWTPNKNEAKTYEGPSWEGEFGQWRGLTENPEKAK
jgi:hypothetical protein